MKKLFCLLPIIGILIGCGNRDQGGVDTTGTDTETTTTTTTDRYSTNNQTAPTNTVNQTDTPPPQ